MHKNVVLLVLFPRFAKDFGTSIPLSWHPLCLLRDIIAASNIEDIIERAIPLDPKPALLVACWFCRTNTGRIGATARCRVWVRFSWKCAGERERKKRGKR